MVRSAAAGRTLHLDRRTVDALQHHRVRQLEIRDAIGPAWQEHDLVFCRVDGRWVPPDRVTKRFVRLVERTGVPRIRLHDVRHSHASLLLQAGAHPKVVSERLGHSSVAFTLDTYSHVLPGMHPEAAEQFADLAFGAAEMPSPDERGDPSLEPHDRAQERDREQS